MHLPHAWLERFTRESPRLALVVLAWGLVLFGFTVWLVVSDWRAGR